MFYEPAKKDHGLPRDPFKSLVVPRPIGWISTVSRDGVLNLGPYSFFNAVSTEPTIVMFGAGGRSGRGVKDSRRIAEETGEFVVNLAAEALAEQMNASSAEVGPEVDEFALAGLETLPSHKVKAPRVKGAPAHFECIWYKTIELPCDDPESSNAMVLGEVVGVHIDDSVITDGFVDILKIRPLGRLGYMDYTVVDNVFTMLRPGMTG